MACLLLISISMISKLPEPGSGRKEFSLYWYDPNGNQIEELRFEAIDVVMARVKSLITNPINKALGTVRKVIVTDGGDCTCFHWENGEVIFPTEEDIRNSDVSPAD